MEGTTVDAKYHVVSLLGRGGMGAVYEAVHLGTGRRVALKVINPDELGSHETIARFKREARASGGIDSQHVVQVLDTGIDPKTRSPYLVLELLNGEDLGQVIDRGPAPWDVVLRVMAQACSGLDKAHRHGIVHRDIKSANLFLARREENEVIVKLLDFGIAKLRPEALPGSNRLKLTRSGSILGSPLYMSPEQVTGSGELDARSDIFSLGVTMYEALCGVAPNQEQTKLGALVVAIGSGKGIPLRTRAPALPDAVIAIVEKATALEPADRFASANEMQATIVALLPGGSALDASMFAPLTSELATTLPRAKDPNAETTTVVDRDPAFAPTMPRGSTAPIRPSSMPAFGRTAPLTLAPPRRSFVPIAAAVAVLLVVAVVGSILWARGRPARTLAFEPPAHSVEATPSSALRPPGVAAVLPSVVPTSVVASAPVASEVPAPPPAASASARSRPRKRLVAPKPSCNPDYYFDASGMKIFKEECL